MFRHPQHALRHGLTNQKWRLILFELDISRTSQKVMDKAATCANSNRRVIIDSGAIMTGAVLSLHTGINANGQGCPDIEKFMRVFASQRFTAYHEFVWWEEKQAEATASGAPYIIAAPVRARPSPLRLRALPGRFIPDHLSHLRSVRGFRPL